MILEEWNTDDAIAFAREEGREDGIEEGRVETARKALAKGCSPELIHDITGLEIEAIRNIQTK